MKRNRPPSKSTQLVLQELLTRPQYGYALMKETGLKSGTLYPILMRLTDRGFLSSKWEQAEQPGRPQRQRYQLTALGRRYALDALHNSETAPNAIGTTS